MNGLDFIESSIKLLIEKSTNYFPWAEKSVEIMSRLIDSIQDILVNHPSSKENPPYRFAVKLNSANAQIWQKNPSWQKDLSNAYIAIIKEYGIRQQFAPTFTLVVKNSLDDKEVVFEEIADSSARDKTSAINSRKKSKILPLPDVESSPILLFGEDKEIKLTTSVITIGRRRSNDVVIDDMRISRTHAQIRHVPEGYMVFDAGSSGGTFINGTRIAQQVLRTGDVISLGGYKFIYLNEGNPINTNTVHDDQIGFEDK